MGVTITLGGSGNYSSMTPDAPWPGGTKPSNGDTISIPAGMVLTIDESTVNTLSAITGAGTLALGTAAGTRSIYVSGSISVANVTGGTAETPMPSDSKTIFEFGAAGKFTTSGVRLYGFVPTVTYTGLSAAFAATIKTTTTATATSIEVTGDVRNWGSCSVWITKLSLKGQSTDAAKCRRTISNIAYDAGSNTSTLTINALTEIKEAGGHVVCENQNIVFNGTGANLLFDNQTGNVTQACRFVTVGGRSVSNGSNHDATNSVFLGHNYCCYSGTGHTVVNSVFVGNSTSIFGLNNLNASGAVFSGNSYATNAGTGNNYSNAVFAGSIYGINGGSGQNASYALFVCNSYGVNGGSGHSLNYAQFISNVSAINYGSGHTATGAIFSGNSTGVYLSNGDFTLCVFGLPVANSTADVGSCNNLLLHKCMLNSNYQNRWTSDSKPSSVYRLKVDSTDHNHVVGDRKCWTLGGYVVNQVEVVEPIYPGNTLRMLCDDVLYPCFIEDEYVLKANTTYKWTWVVQKDTTSMTATPSMELVDKFADTFDGNAPLASVTMADNTGTWQILTLTYTPSVDKHCWLRVRAQHGTGVVYFKTFLQKPTERRQI